MPKLDLDSATPSNSTGYPAPFDAQVAGRWHLRLARLGGLSEFGASHVTLEPGAWSSQRHWHDGEDELLVMLSGEAVLVEDEGRTRLRPGDICAWPKGVANGHHLRNESDAPCTFVCISGGAGTTGGYSDIDMMFDAEGYKRKDGTRYEAKRVR